MLIKPKPKKFWNVSPVWGKSSGGAPSPSYSLVVSDRTSQTSGGTPFTSSALTPAGGTSGAHQLCIVAVGFQSIQGTISNFTVNGSAAMTNITGFGTLGLSAIFAGPATIPAGTFTVSFACTAPGFSDINLTVWVADNLISTTPVASAVTNGNATSTFTVTSAGGTVSAGHFVFASATAPGGAGGGLSWTSSGQIPAQTASTPNGAFNTATAEADWTAASAGITTGNYVATVVAGTATGVDAALAVWH